MMLGEIEVVGVALPEIAKARHPSRSLASRPELRFDAAGTLLPL